MSTRRWLISVIAILAAVGCRQKSTSMAPFGQNAVINGIDSKEVGAFWADWKLVSTRYRTDNQQMRFVFANESAWKTLEEGKHDFKDGAMLAKISFAAEADETFPSSMMPSQFNRVQVMKRDSKRYAGTDGWGYAIFSRDPVDEVRYDKFPVACHACHALAKQRNFVFTRAAFLEQEKRADKDSSLRAQFTESTTAPENLTRRLKLVGWPVPPKIRRLTMPMFQGTVWESLASVASFSAQDGIPFMIDHESGAQILYVRPAKPIKNCKESAEFFATVGRKELVVGTLCDGKRTITRRINPSRFQ